MNAQQAIREMKAVCIEEAAIFMVPPALIEIMLIGKMFNNKRIKYLIPAYLAGGPLHRMLYNRKGSYKILLDKRQPTIVFADGSCVGDGMDADNPSMYRWEALIYLVYMEITPVTRDEIMRSLSKKISKFSVNYYF